MSTTIITRSSKGGRLSFNDMDNNLLNLQATADAAAVKTAVDAALALKADKATTLAGYGITDAYTKSAIDADLALKANISSLALVATSGSYADLSGKPTTVSTFTNDAGYLVANDITGKAALGGSSSHDFAVNSLTVSGNIMPAVTGVSTIGSATDKFAAIYTKEMHIDANTLYVDGVPVLGSSANTIQITADVNQGMRVATTGSGQTVLDSQASTIIQTNGSNADVVIQASGNGSLARITSATQVTLTAPTVAVAGNGTISGSLTVAGDFTVAGARTVVNSTSMTVEDNIITLNKGEPSDGITLDSAGIEIDRGALARQRMVFKQSTGKWMMGPAGQEINVASEAYVTSALSGNVSSSSLATVATTGSYADLLNKPTIPSVPSVVSAFTNDSGYQTAANVTTAIANKADKATTLSGYGITDAYTKTQVDTAISAATPTFSSLTGKPTTLSGYGITDAYTKTQVDTAISAATPTFSSLTGKPTTLIGYGITDAQSLDAKLTSISGLSSVSTGLVKLTNGVASFDSNTYLTGNQTITVSGDATGSGTTAISLTLANSGVTAGTYGTASKVASVVVNAKGLVTGVTETSIAIAATAVSGLATVATSGSYTDLTSKPTIPTVPTAVSAFTNDSGYQTASQVSTAIQAVVGAAPAALDTLVEIAAQLATDESAAAALTTTVSTKAATTYVDAQDATKMDKVSTGTISGYSLTTSATTSGQVVGSFSATSYRSAKFLVQVTSGTSYQVSEVMVIHDGTNVYISEFGEMHTGAVLAAYDADISGGNVRLLVTPTNTVTTLKAVCTTVNI